MPNNPEYEISVKSEDSDFHNKKKEQIDRERNLVQAAIDGCHEKILELLKSNVSVDAIEYNELLFYALQNYNTPLQLAAAHGYLKCVQILIEHGADVNAKDRFSVTALHMAAEKGNYFCLKALLDAGAYCSLPIKLFQCGYIRTKQDKVPIPHVGGTTPLHLAAANNHVDCVRELIKYGADYNAIDECGRTSLYIAAENGFSECVLAHLKIYVGRAILSLPGFKNNDIPLHLAVRHRMNDCVRELLHLGSDANCLNNSGYSPLHQVLNYPDNTTNSFEMLKLLILEGYNTDMDLCDSEGYTLLDHVCFNVHSRNFLRRPQMAQFLIAYGANVNKNWYGIRLLEIELKYIEENDILLYIVRSMLQLPSLAELSSSHKRVSDLSDDKFFNRRLRKVPIWKPERKLWYEKLASNPRTLQHCCRFVIRQTLGSFRIKHVHKLPIALALISYILLERD